MGMIWDAAAIAISCQVATAPAAWLHFGAFPKYFLLTNLLAVPLTTVVMLTSIAVVVLSAAGICPDILLTANEAAVAVLRTILETIASM